MSLSSKININFSDVLLFKKNVTPSGSRILLLADFTRKFQFKANLSIIAFIVNKLYIHIFKKF